MTALDMKNPGLAGTRTGAETEMDAHINTTPSSAQQDPHGFESVGSILRGLKLAGESSMTDQFDPALSLKLDAIETQSQALREEVAL